jgi:long-subunit fatty acid transport protein
MKMSIDHTTRILVLSATLALAAGSADAQSVGVYRGAVGAREAALAGADNALGTLPIDAVAWNPAGLALFETPDLDVGIAALGARGSFANRVDANGSLTDARGVIPEGAFAMPLGGTPFVFGAGLIADGAVAGSWRYQDVPGAAGATYGLAVHRSGVLVLRPTVGVGARLNSRVAVGGSLSLVWNRNDLEAPYIFQTQAPLVGLKTLLDIHTTGTGWGSSLGAVVMPHRSVTAGVAWRSGTRLTTEGTASGDAWAQFAAVGVAADSTFEYSAAVRNAFPSMLAAGARWEITPEWRLSGQLERWGWQEAFAALPITLTDGTNAVINSLVGGGRIDETVPLEWRNQVVRRIGTEYVWRPSVVLRAGYAYAPSSVPTTTLTPMTAAIVEHTLGFGVGVSQGKMRMDVGFLWSPTSRRDVADTMLQGSEYDATSVAVGAQGLVVSVGRRF